MPSRTGRLSGMAVPSDAPWPPSCAICGVSMVEQGDDEFDPRLNCGGDCLACCAGAVGMTIRDYVGAG